MGPGSDLSEELVVGVEPDALNCRVAPERPPQLVANPRSSAIIMLQTRSARRRFKQRMASSFRVLPSAICHVVIGARTTPPQRLDRHRGTPAIHDDLSRSGLTALSQSERIVMCLIMRNGGLALTLCGGGGRTNNDYRSLSSQYYWGVSFGLPSRGSTTSRSAIDGVPWRHPPATIAVTRPSSLASGGAKGGR